MDFPVHSIATLPQPFCGMESSSAIGNSADAKESETMEPLFGR